MARGDKEEGHTSFDSNGEPTAMAMGVDPAGISRPPPPSDGPGAPPNGAPPNGALPNGALPDGARSVARKELVADPSLRANLARVLSRRVDANDVEDLVQTTLAEAFTSRECPNTKEEVQRFVFAIARQRVIDLYRKRERERRRDTNIPSIEHAEPLGRAADLLRWAEGELPDAPADAHQTFDWMLRESEGETLADIAQEERVPAPVVRKRVSRLRQFFRRRWTKEIAALGLLGVMVLAATLLLRRQPTPTVASNTTPTPDLTPSGTTAIQPDPLSSTQGLQASNDAPPTPTSTVLAPPTATTPLPVATPPAPKPSLALNTPPPPPPKDLSSSLDEAAGKKKEPTPPRNNASDAPFDRGAAAAALGGVDVQACRQPDGPTGAGHVTVTFEPSGKPSQVIVDSGPFVGTPTGGCIAGKYRGVRVPAFGGAPVRVGKSFAIN